jgi:ABC-type transport system involved in multi-copper enzyme maturation permease subunit
MNTPFKAVWTVARHELADSVRSWRVIVLILLYFAGSIAATALFITVLQRIERQLVESMGLAAVNNAGSVTATLWKSDAFRRILTDLIGDRQLAESLLAIPPLALFYGWLSFAFAPALVMLGSSSRISEEIWTGSVRFMSFRVSRLHWCLGKFAGQAAQLFLALILSAIGAWIVGRLRMHSFEPLASAQAMLIFSAKAWFYAVAFLGLATGISQMCAAPNLALALGFISLIVVSILSELSKHFAGDGIRRLWDLVNILVPGGHRMDLWWGDAAHMLPALVFLPALGFGYLLIGYLFFSRRDL